MKKQILNLIKRLIINTLATTALSIFLMCFVAFIKGFTLMSLAAPFQILLVNFLAHIAIILFDKINMKYRIFNYVAMLVFLIGIIIGFGFLFDWFAVNEIWIVCIVGIVVFIVALIIDIVKLNQAAKEINSDLEKLRKQKNKDKSE